MLTCKVNTSNPCSRKRSKKRKLLGTSLPLPCTLLKNKQWRRSPESDSVTLLKWRLMVSLCVVLSNSLLGAGTIFGISHKTRHQANLGTSKLTLTIKASVETSTPSSCSCMILTTTPLLLCTNGMAAKASHRRSVSVTSLTMPRNRLFTSKSTRIGQSTTQLKMLTLLSCPTIQRLSFTRATTTSLRLSARRNWDVAACAP